MSGRSSMPLVAMVEKLTTAGYVVFTHEQGEEAAVLLGWLSLSDTVPRELSDRAEELLSTWPGRDADEPSDGRDLRGGLLL